MANSVLRKFDVVVSGSSVSSYLCSALFSVRGYRVLLVDESEVAAGSSANAEFFHSIAQHALLYFPEIKISGNSDLDAFAQSLNEIQRHTHSNLLSFWTPETVNQVLTPTARIRFEADMASTLAELNRELRSGADEATRFFEMIYRIGAELPEFAGNVALADYGSLLDKQRWRKVLGKYYSAISSAQAVGLDHEVKAPELKVLSRALLGAHSYANPESAGVEQIVRGLAASLGPRRACMGGAAAFNRALTTVIENFGGLVRKSTRLLSLECDGQNANSRVIGAVLSTSDGMIEADAFVIGSQHRKVYASLPPRAVNPAVYRAIGRVRASHWRYTLAVVVKRDAIPPGVSQFMTFVSSEKLPLEEENFLTIQTIDSAEANSKDAVLLVSAMVPNMPSSFDYRYLRILSGKMLRSLIEIMPFVENSLVRLAPDFRAGENEIRELYPFDSEDGVAEGLLHYYVQGQRQAQDFWGLPWSTPHLNVYFSGRSVWPALGVYGEALAARRIVDDYCANDARLYPSLSEERL